MVMKRQRFCLFCGKPIYMYYYFCSDDCRRLYYYQKEIEEYIEALQEIENETPKIHPLCKDCEYNCKIKTAYPEGKLICKRFPDGIDYKEERNE